MPWLLVGSMLRKSASTGGFEILGMVSLRAGVVSPPAVALPTTPSPTASSTTAPRRIGGVQATVLRSRRATDHKTPALDPSLASHVLFLLRTTRASCSVRASCILAYWKS